MIWAVSGEDCLAACRHLVELTDGDAFLHLVDEVGLPELEEVTGGLAAAAVTAKELAATPLILRESGSGTREVLEAGLQTLGLQVTALVELGSTTAIKSAVQAGDGPAVVSRLAATNEAEEGKLIVVPVDGFEPYGRRRFRFRPRLARS